MSIYEISIYFILLSLSITILASLRVAARKGAPTALAGLSGATIATATGLIIIGEVTPISFSTDIALYLLVLGPVGTIIISKMLPRGGVQ